MRIEIRVFKVRHHEEGSLRLGRRKMNQIVMKMNNFEVGAMSSKLY